ncbi:MAG: hypothetical protein D6803_01090 [Anaerolineae bacterium]|nr:MAG: hypothetical protein D6803_01090 [Anaerolineae bacterium]
MSKDIFKILLLIARPAAGKSEILFHLRNTPLEERIRRYHIGKMVEIDDFPMLWAWFEEDDILSEMGYPRLHSDPDYNFLGKHLWNVLIRRISLEYRKLRRDHPHLHQEHTVLIEFARGKEHGGFREAFRHLSDEIVERMGVMYINVSWEESLRKNRARFNPQRPDSILEHGLPDEKMEKLYRYVDWEETSADDPHFLTIQGRRVPYVVFENEDDVTTRGGEALAARLEETLGRLWRIYS